MSGQGAHSAPSAWAAHAVGGADVASLQALATAAPTSLNGAELVDAISACEKGRSLLDGVQLPGMLAGFGAIPPGLVRSTAVSAGTITA